MDTEIQEAAVRLAAQNIALEVGTPPSGNVLIFCSREKMGLAERVAESLDQAGLEYHILLLGVRLNSSLERLRKLIEDSAGSWGLVILLHPRHANFLFKVIGRPDLGVRIPEKHLFCDWLIHPDSLVRTFAVDRGELASFRQNLQARLGGSKELRVVSEAGTDIVLHPRTWQATSGEVFTAPIERQTNGKIWVDGCAYGGPPENPFRLEIENGRVTNVKSLDREDRQQTWVRTDLSRDEQSNVLAEFGIGVNPGAEWNQELMESEQARGTCHFGFGNNLAYGGMNVSSYHFDLVVRFPTIEVDGRIIFRRGEYV